MKTMLLGTNPDGSLAPPNLRTVRKSRQALRPGDIFALDHVAGWVFGRVMMVDVPRERAPMPNANLVYIYACVAADPEPPLEQMTPDALLLPPLWINWLGCYRGATMTVAHCSLESGDWLRRHCFDAHTRRPTFYDEHGNRRWFRSEPCGRWALAGYIGLDRTSARRSARLIH